MERIPLETGEYYHIYNRGVDKRVTFTDEKDYARFVAYLYAVNEDKHIRPRGHRFPSESPELSGLGSTLPKRPPLVEIIAFALMPNHFHLLARQAVDGGISKFMQRLITAYTMYFNDRYERSGALFQGRYKCKAVSEEEYLLHLINYIHLNPLDIIESKWEERGISNLKKAKDFLEKYKWSSYRDAIGVPSLRKVFNLPLLREFVGKSDEYKEFINEWYMPDDLEFYLF